MTIRVTSPDGGISATLTGRMKLGITFLGDSYRYYSEEDVEHQLEGVCRGLSAGYRQGRKDVITDAKGEAPDLNKPHWDKRVRGFREAVMETSAEGVSAKEKIRIDTVFLRDFSVSVKDGCLDELSEQEFSDEVQSAIEDLIADWFMVTRVLKEEHLYE